MTNVRERKWLQAAAAVILSVMVALSMIPLTAATVHAAKVTYTTPDGFVFDVFADGGSASVVLTGYTGSGTALILPASITVDGTTYTVVGNGEFSLAETAFANPTPPTSNITSIEIPDGYDAIMGKAFKGATSLEELVINGSGLYLAPDAFKGCTATDYYFNNDISQYGLEGSGIATDSSGNPIGDVTVWTSGGSNVEAAITALNQSRPADKQIEIQYGTSCSHVWDKGVITTPATCTAKGVKTFTCTKCGRTRTEPINALGHKWDGGKVTKKATTTATGVKTYTCERCKATKTETIPMLPETPYSKGATEEQVDKAITSITNDKDPKGTTFCILQLRVKATTKKSISLQWAGVKGAKKYIVYGNHCNKGSKKYKFVKLKVTKGKSVKFTKIAKKKVTKATFYKFIVVALDKNNKVIATSKSVHIPTKGGKKLTYKKVTVSKKTLKKAKALKKGKTLKIKATAVKENKKVKAKPHRPLAYESSNPSIATVTSKGVIKGKKKGSCTVYVYAQNGVFAKIPVKVK